MYLLLFAASLCSLVGHENIAVRYKHDFIPGGVAISNCYFRASHDLITSYCIHDGEVLEHTYVPWGFGKRTITGIGACENDNLLYVDTNLGLFVYEYKFRPSGNVLGKFYFAEAENKDLRQRKATCANGVLSLESWDKTRRAWKIARQGGPRLAPLADPEMGNPGYVPEPPEKASYEMNSSELGFLMFRDKRREVVDV